MISFPESQMAWNTTFETHDRKEAGQDKQLEIPSHDP